MSSNVGLQWRGEEVANKNITHNLILLWQASGAYAALYLSEGRRAREVIEILSEGISKLRASPNFYQQFDTPNGGGWYADALPWLEDLLKQFQQYPEGVITICK